MADVIWEGDVSTDPTVAGNWSTGLVPAAGEDVIFDSTATDNCAGGAIAANINSVTRTPDCTITIGTSAAVPLSFQCTAQADRYVNDRGSGAAYWQGDDVASWQFRGTGTCSIDGTDNTALVIDAPNVTVTVGPVVGTPAEFATITVNDGRVTITACEDVAGGGAAFDLHIFGGIVGGSDAIDDLRVYGGTYTHESQPTDDVWVLGGTVVYNSTGKIDGTLIVYNGGTITFEDGQGAVTVDDAHFYGGSTVRDGHARVTWTAAWELHGCDLTGTTINMGANTKYTVAAI